jgi:hypothetical protein
MSNVTPIRSGQANQSGDARAIFLSKFGGEVLKKFLDSVQMEKWTFHKHLDSGKSAEFPYTSDITAAYHTPGTFLAGANVNNANKVITIDDLVVAHAWVNKLDSLMEHWDNRRPYVEAMGNALAVLKDEHIMIEGILGARASAIVTGSPAGSTVVNDKYKVDGVGTVGSLDIVEQVAAFSAGLSEAAKILDENNVPRSLRRYCVVKPALYHALTEAVQANGFSFFNKDYNGATGNLSTNMVPPIHGFEIIMSNHLPTTNIAQGASAAASNYYYHYGDFTKTIALCGVQDAVGTVSLQDVKMEMGDYDPTRKATFMSADYASGHSFLRPECLIELKLNTLVN